MAVCSTCTPTKPIARCITNLIVGKIEQISTAVRVYIYNVTLDKTIEYSVTSSGDGTVTVPITPQRFSEDHAYEISITTADSIGISEKQTINVGETYADCVKLRFVTIWESDNTIATFTNQTLSTV